MGKLTFTWRRNSRPGISWNIALFFVFALLVCDVHWAYAQDNQQPATSVESPVSAKKSIRFYKVNKQLQADRIFLTGNKAAALGCQNFLKKVRVHRAVQIGYVACTLYEKKQCDANSIIAVASEKDPRRTSLLTEGKAWFTYSDNPRGVKLGSWNCAMDIQPEQWGYEARLAAKEAKRLKKVAQLEARKAQQARAKASKAEEFAANATAAAAEIKAKALAAGVEIIEPLKAGAVIDSEVGSEEKQ